MVKTNSSLLFVGPLVPLRSCDVASTNDGVMAVRQSWKMVATGGFRGRVRGFLRGAMRPPMGNRGGAGVRNGSGGQSGDGGAGGSGTRRSGQAGDAPGDKSAGLFGSIWAAYIAALESQPILTKALTSLVGFTLGDILAQKLLGSKDAAFDLRRLARMASFGFLIHGPVGHFFYGALDRAIPGTEAWKVVSKVAIDQVAWAPIFTVVFLSYIGALEGKSKKEIQDKVKNDTWAGVTGSWKVWPVVHAINFRFIPTQQRMLYINTIQVAYNVFLSFLGNRSKAE
mmetsp:Transcript_14714/g.29949  ORF Transcript_14714/g.29949 Transcript_14714/m.29949 type:complete len:283 (-) Transcript_14714:80-928(-)